jgi:hypothetical protein
VHDEDPRYGLNVENESGGRWRCYGDNSYFNKENQRNRELCEKAVKVSIQEIYQVYQTKNGAPVYCAGSTSKAAMPSVSTSAHLTHPADLALVSDNDPRAPSGINGYKRLAPIHTKKRSCLGA